MAALRPDLVFSYWIYIWFLLYVFKIINFSPKFPLIIGLIDNIIMLIMMFLYGTNYITILYFIVINTLIKIIPLYYLWREPIKLKDIYFTVILAFVFILWLHINKESLIGNIKLIHDSLLYSENKTPFISLMNKIKNNFKNLQLV
jgi:hypothetical protein